MNKKVGKRKLSKKRIIKYGCIALIFTILLISVTYGRYIYNAVNERFLQTKKFYFNSDKLDVNRPIYQIENWSAVNDYVIVIDLNSYLNNYEASPYDIDYEITYSCSTNVTCNLSKTSGIIRNSNNHDDFMATIAPSASMSDGDSAFLEVKATSISPYRKEIKARFILNVGQMGLSYSIDDSRNSPYLNFDITNTLDYYLVKTPFGSYNLNDRINLDTYLALTEAERDKCQSVLITLSFDPNVVVLDMTSSAYLRKISETTTTIDGFQYINSITFKMDAIQSEVVRFYKKNTTLDYTYPFTNNTSIITFQSS